MEGNTGKGFTVSGVLLTLWIAFRARNSLPLVAMSIALTFVVSVVVWRYFDSPISKWRQRVLSREGVSGRIAA